MFYSAKVRTLHEITKKNAKNKNFVNYQLSIIN